MWNLSLFFYLATVVDTNGKKWSNVLILIYRQCFNFFNNIVSTFFKFTLTFSMLQVSSNYPHKHTNCIQKTKSRSKKNCIWLEKHIVSTCYSPNIWPSFSNNRLSFWFPLKISKSQRIFWLSVWKSWTLVLK